MQIYLKLFHKVEFTATRAHKTHQVLIKLAIFQTFLHKHKVTSNKLVTYQERKTREKKTLAGKKQTRCVTSRTTLCTHEKKNCVFAEIFLGLWSRNFFKGLRDFNLYQISHNYRKQLYNGILMSIYMFMGKEV